MTPAPFFPNYTELNILERIDQYHAHRHIDPRDFDAKDFIYLSNSLEKELRELKLEQDELNKKLQNLGAR